MREQRGLMCQLHSGSGPFFGGVDVFVTTLWFALNPPLVNGLNALSNRVWNIIHLVPYKTPCTIFHPFEYFAYFGPS